MSEAERLLREYVRAGDSRDYAALERLLHTAVITHSPGDLTTHGVEAQVTAWRAAHEGLDGLTHEIQAVIGSGDGAAARVRVHGVHTGCFLGLDPTGAPIEVDQALFVRVEASRIVEMWEIVDTGSGLRQLGALGDQPLSPGPGSTASRAPVEGACDDT